MNAPLQVGHDTAGPARPMPGQVEADRLPDASAGQVLHLLAGLPATAGQQRGTATLGGVHLRTPMDAACTTWLASLRRQLPPATPWVRVPVNVTLDALLGGLDLSATLAAGRPVARTGLLAHADGGVLVLTQVGRMQPVALATIQQALDAQCVQLAREGLQGVYPARFLLIVIDEDADDDASESASGVPAGLRDRLAFSLDAGQLAAWWHQEGQPAKGALQHDPALADPRLQTGSPVAEDALAVDEQAALGALCFSAWQLGIASLRAPLLAWSVAGAFARAGGRDLPDATELERAATLVFTARARCLPPVPPATADTQADGQDADPADTAGSAEASGGQDPAKPVDAADAANAPSPASAPAAAEPPAAAADAGASSAPGSAAPSSGSAQPATPPAPAAVDSQGQALALTQAVANSLPARLLERLQLAAPGTSSGRVSAFTSRRSRPIRHGRPVGVEPGDPRQGRTLDLLATLRVALPWQKLRSPPVHGARLAIRASDFRVRALKPRTRSTAVFAVDASGSAALQRLAEAKGAIESLLAQCYVRRDQVALISFRGNAAEVLLPPTRSLSRVRRELSALPGGGGTPLAQGIDLAAQVANEVRRRGDAPLLVLLTDGRANVSRAGIGGRGQAETDALAAARAVATGGLPCLLIDIARQAQPKANALAQALGAEYLLLPGGRSDALSAAVKTRMRPAGAATRA